LDTEKSFGWYDYALRIKGNELFERRLAGRIETGLPSKTDPQIGNLSIESDTFSV
jgi:phospholipase C